jgi:hypothetical protein
VSDPRREAYLESEIRRLQEAKLTALKNVRVTTGSGKVTILDHFLEMDKKQEKFESELETLLEG